MDQLREDIDAGLAILPVNLGALAARVLLYATSRQENPGRSPRQIIRSSKTGKLEPIGPAAGDYQMEKGGGIHGLLNFKSPTVQSLLAGACKSRGVQQTGDAIFAAIQTDPILAAALARLLYYTDPKALPALGDESGAWWLYLRVWRPGAYDRQPDELRAKWRKSYAEAMKAYER